MCHTIKIHSKNCTNRLNFPLYISLWHTICSSITYLICHFAGLKRRYWYWNGKFISYICFSRLAFKMFLQVWRYYNFLLNLIFVIHQTSFFVGNRSLIWFFFFQILMIDQVLAVILYLFFIFVTVLWSVLNLFTLNCKFVGLQNDEQGGGRQRRISKGVNK